VLRSKDFSDEILISQTKLMICWISCRIRKETSRFKDLWRLPFDTAEVKDLWQSSRTKKKMAGKKSYYGLTACLHKMMHNAVSLVGARGICKER